MKRGPFAAVAFIVAAVSISGCSDGTGPEDPTPARLTLNYTEVTLGDGESVTLVATVYDDADRAIEGVEVAWSSADPTIATVQNGAVTGQRPGTTEITATAGQVSATAAVTVERAPARLQKVSGDVQTGRMGRPLPDSLVVRVLDRQGNGMPGVPVIFEVMHGGGMVSPTPVITNATGHAATAWVLGSDPLPQKVLARAEGLEGSPAEFTATAENLIAVGDTIYGHIARSGEVDLYRFAGKAGQLITMFFQMLSGPRSLEATLFLDYGTSSQRKIGELDAHRERDLEAFPSGRKMLPADGIYTIRIAGGTGAYRFLVFPIDLGPESVPDTVAIGETIAGESIYPIGDIDVFTFSATAGKVVDVEFRYRGGNLRLDVYDGYGTPEAVLLGSQWTAEGDAVVLRGLTLPRSGWYQIVVTGEYDMFVGSYQFRLRPSN